MHMIFECKAYADIRLVPKYTCLYSHIVGGDMKRFFSHNPQNILADLVTDMTFLRKTMLIKMKTARLRLTDV